MSRCTTFKSNENLLQSELEGLRGQAIKDKSSKDCTWSAVPNALLGVIS